MNNLEKLREAKNWSKQYVADRLGVSVSLIFFWENGKRRIPDEKLNDLCDLFGKTSDEILGREKSNIINVYGTIPAGIPLEMVTDIIDTEEIDPEMLKGNRQYFGLRVSGDSMFPTYLDKDILICEKVDDAESGQDCIVTINGDDATFKKILKKENGIVLQPINPLYNPVFYSNEEIEKLPIKIIGVVREIRRKV